MLNPSALFPLNDDRPMRLPQLDGALQLMGGESAGNGLPKLPWSAADRLTISFAPDGTQISKYQSDLYSAFRPLLTANQIETQILKAFQTWAKQAGVNIGYKTDDPTVDFGSQSRTQDNPLVGDIRVGAIPMESNVYAVSIPHDAAASGQWAGTLLFNSDASFQNISQFYAVALHEIGHLLGLEHSSDPNSVMNPTMLKQSLGASDIAQLRNLYGIRSLDLNDADKPNQTIANATRIENPGSLAGTVPLTVYGDITANGDVDYYRLPPLSGYAGSITFSFFGRGISLLRPKLSIFDEDGAFVSSTQAGGMRGSDLQLTIPIAGDGVNYFARVEAMDGSQYAIGSYSLVATFDANVQATAELIRSVALSDYALLKQSDVRKRFLFPDDFYFDQELQLNDTFALANSPKSSLGHVQDMHYQIDASFSYANDLDFYRFKSPDAFPTDGTLTLMLDLLESNKVVPNLQVFDAQQQLLASQTIVNGNGQLVVQVSGILAADEYFVRASADLPNDDFSKGNYSLTARFDQATVNLESLASHSVSNSHRGRMHTLYVAETQLFHFGLTASAAFPRTDTQLWLTVYNAVGEVVYRDLTNPGQKRTTQSVILRPGSYLMHVQMAVRPGAVLGPDEMSYSIDGLRIDDPMGPEILPPGEKPFKKESPTSPNYVYPNNILSPDTMLIVGGQQINPPPGSVNPNPYVDANAWYWTPDYLDPP